MLPAFVIPAALGAAIITGLTWAYRKSLGAAIPAATSFNTRSALSKGLVEKVQPADTDMVQVQLGDQTWLVTRDYIGPIGINEAANLASSFGMELPSPNLVDAIWRQADLKLVPMPRNNIVSQAVFDDQARKIQEQIAGRPFTLLGGAFKDVVTFGGKPQIYGWHVDVENGKNVPGIPLLKPFTTGPGKIIQPLSGSRHDQAGPIGFKDYSQGLRLVKRIA